MPQPNWAYTSDKALHIDNITITIINAAVHFSYRVGY